MPMFNHLLKTQAEEIKIPEMLKKIRLSHLNPTPLTEDQEPEEEKKFKRTELVKETGELIKMKLLKKTWLEKEKM